MRANHWQKQAKEHRKKASTMNDKERKAVKKFGKLWGKNKWQHLYKGHIQVLIINNAAIATEFNSEDRIKST